MTWTADTLKPINDAIQLLPENLLVFSPNDIWLVSYSDIARGLLWHYDGKNWTESNIAADVGGMRVNDIAGYNSSNLWTVGYSGDEIFIARYDGTHWTRQNNMNIKGELLDMSKDPSGNLWACGRNGVIMKYDKTKWIADTIKVGYLDKYPDAGYLLKSVEYHKDRIYALGSVFDFDRRREVYYFFSGDINNWTIVDSMIIDSPSSTIKWGNRHLYASVMGKLYSVGLAGLWVYKNNNWEIHYNSGASLNGIYGINENYLIAVGDFQQVLFYDGNNWSDIRDLFHLIDPYFVFENVWTDGYETFIMGRNFQGYPTKTIIWHGK